MSQMKVVCLPESNVFSGPLPIFKLECLFLLLSYTGSSYILDISSLCEVLFANIFSHSVDCLSVVLMIPFDVQKLCSLM